MAENEKQARKETFRRKTKEEVSRLRKVMCCSNSSTSISLDRCRLWKPASISLLDCCSAFMDAYSRLSSLDFSATYTGTLTSHAVLRVSGLRRVLSVSVVNTSACPGPGHAFLRHTRIQNEMDLPTTCTGGCHTQSLQAGSGGVTELSVGFGDTCCFSVLNHAYYQHVGELLGSE